jgi:hypothetical protein
MGSLCVPAAGSRYAKLGGRAKRENEENRTLANLVTTPSERLANEKMDQRERDAERAGEMRQSRDRLADTVYQTDGEIERLEKKATIAKQRYEALNRQVNEAPELVPLMREFMQMQAGTKERRAQAVPPDMAPLYQDWEVARATWLVVANLRTVMRTQSAMAAIQLHAMDSARVLELGSAAMAEVRTTFNSEDARRLQQEFAQSSNELRNTLATFSRIQAGAPVAQGSGALGIGLLPPMIQPEDMVRRQRELVPQLEAPRSPRPPRKTHVGNAVSARGRRPPSPPPIPAAVPLPTPEEDGDDDDGS